MSRLLVIVIHSEYFVSSWTNRTRILIPSIRKLKTIFLMQNKWAIDVHIFSCTSSWLVPIATCDIFTQFSIEGAVAFVGKNLHFFYHLFWHYAEDIQSIQNTLSHTLFFFLFGVVVIFSHLFIRIGVSDERQRRHQRTKHSTDFRINL